jgi:hypothetical protein
MTTPDTTTMTPEVCDAVDEIRAAFPETNVEAHDDGSGGSWIVVEPVDPGAQYVQRETWVGFLITFQYPVSDCYPHFVRPDLARVDHQPLGEATSIGTFGFDGRPAVQISRQSRRLNPATDTALTKLWKVLDWLATR